MALISLIDSVRKAQGLQSLIPSQKELTAPAMSYSPMLSLGVSSDSMTDEFQEIYQIQSTVYKCIQVISNSFAALPVEVYEVGKDGEKEVLSGEQEFDVLRDPNPWMTGYDFWESVIGFLELTGECPIALIKEGNNLKGLIPLRPDKVKVIPHKTEMISHYVFSNSSSSESFRIERDEMVFLKYFNPMSDYRGLSPMKAAQLDIELDLRAISTNKNMMAQGARPSGIISTDAQLNDHIWSRYQSQFESKYSGQLNRGKIMFLDSGMKWQQIGMSNEELQYAQQRQWTKDTVSEVYGVPPIYLMQFKDASVLANAEVQHKLLWTTTLIPKIRKISDLLTKHLVPLMTQRDGVSISFDVSNVAALQPDKAKLSETFDKALKNGSASPNDYREYVLGLSRKEDDAMDLHYVPMNIIPLDSAQLDSEPEPAEKVNNALGLIQDTIDIMNGGKDISGDITEVAKQVNSKIDLTDEKIWRYKGLSIIQRLEKRVVKKFSNKLIKLFNAQMREVVSNLANYKAFKTFDTSAVNINLEAWIGEFEAAGEVYIADALTFAATDMANDLGIVYNVTDPNAASYINNRSSKYSSLVNNTTYTQVKSVLETAVAEGLTIAETTAKIKEYFENNREFRAARIARTETMSAGNYGRLDSMKQGKIEYHRWSSQRDAFVRDDHAQVDGEVVKLGYSFSVGGNYIGDSTYPSDINERCYTIPSKAPGKSVKFNKKPKCNCNQDSKGGWDNY